MQFWVLRQSWVEQQTVMLHYTRGSITDHPNCGKCVCKSRVSSADIWTWTFAGGTWFCLCNKAAEQHKRWVLFLRHGYTLQVCWRSNFREVPLLSSRLRSPRTTWYRLLTRALPHCPPLLSEEVTWIHPIATLYWNPSRIYILCAAKMVLHCYQWEYKRDMFKLLCI